MALAFLIVTKLVVYVLFQLVVLCFMFPVSMRLPFIFYLSLFHVYA